MADILLKIVREKRKALSKQKRLLTLEKLEELAGRNRKRDSFYSAVTGRTGLNVIGEIKKASPSLGDIRKGLNVYNTARQYKEAGVRALSVLTEERFFKGSLFDVRTAKRASGLPILRKDFLFDPYQVYESRAFGADAILLIAKILPLALLKELLVTATSIRLDCLVEVHDEKDLEKALSAGAKLIGINNRDLTDFKIDMKKGLELLPQVPKRIAAVIESGIRTGADVRSFRRAGARAFLIGELFMKSKNIKKTLMSLRGGL
jgi:indole-3-glycerol phosphate synthase